MSDVTSKIIDLAMMGRARGEIAERLKVPISTIYWTISQARKSGYEFPKAPRKRRSDRLVHVRVNPEILNKLEDASEELGITAKALAAELLEKIVADDLVSAVLDREAPND